METSHTNVFGITTHYGPHPEPPGSWRRRLHHSGQAAATAALAAGFTLVGLVKALRR